MAKQERKEKSGAEKYRITVMNDDSHKELWFIRISKVNLILVVVAVVLLIMTGTYFLTSRTLLRYTIPGYPNAATKEAAIDNLLKIKELEQSLDNWAFQVYNIQRITSGKDPIPPDSLALGSQTVEVDEAKRAEYAVNDSLLREEIRQEEQFNLTFKKDKITQIEGLHFYPPVKGMITEGYNPAGNHPFVDIAAPANTPVCAVLDGTVVAAGWNDDTGYTIQIQHEGDIITFYKHNGKLLKKVGDKVTAGTTIALLGNSGRLSSGAHLHFELWHKGEAIDPALYIKF